MSAKQLIVGDLGEAALLLPDAVNKALISNDRVKYLISLLQNALARGVNSQATVSNLGRERIVAGVDDRALDEVTEQACLLEDGMLYVPGCRRIFDRITDAVREMYSPIGLGLDSGLIAPEPRLRNDYQRRIDTLTAPAFEILEDRVDPDLIRAMARTTPSGGDSLHLLVMDLHKRLNELQVLLAEETLGGAKVYGVLPDDRPLILAFMKGLNETAPLKFDHPGLGTTATRMGGTLILQNDIGTTDAHVLVIHVAGMSVSLTCTDIHPNRLQFFKTLFPFDVSWEDTNSRMRSGLEKDSYYLCTGSFIARDRDELMRYLAHLGSRIVFLIDWNKARKRLRHFVKNRDALALLKWAADNDMGHRGFLEMGGEKLVYEAVDYAAKTPLHYGQPLGDVLGRDKAIDYLKYVLRTTSQDLRAGRSERLIRDEVKTELLKYFRTAHQSLLGTAERHAELIFEIADAVRNGLIRAPLGHAEENLRRTAARCREWEHQADLVLNEARDVLRHSVAPSGTLKGMLEEADDAADSLEESASLLTLLSPNRGLRPLYTPVQTLAGHLVEASREYIKCLESAVHVHPRGAKADLDDFLESVDRIVEIEHAADEAARDMTVAVVQHAPDFRQLHVFSEIARTLEESSDCLCRSGLLLRELVLDEVMSS